MEHLIRELCDIFREVIFSPARHIPNHVLNSTGSKLIGNRVFWHSVDLDIFICVDMDNYDVRVMPQIDEDVEKWPAVDDFILEVVMRELAQALEELMDAADALEKSLVSGELFVQNLFFLVEAILESRFYQGLLKEYGGYVEGGAFIWHLEEENLFAVIDPGRFSANIVQEPHDTTGVATTMDGKTAQLVMAQIAKVIKTSIPPVTPLISQVYQGPFSLS
jgi:hypothetical protein